MKTILISSKNHGNQIILVDDDDFDMVTKHKWGIGSSGNKLYAIACINGIRIRLHTFIMGVHHDRIDHIDNNGLNCTRINMRGCTHGQNLRNRGACKSSKSGYKGVWKSKTKRGKEIYLSQIMYNYKRISVGYFHSLKDAVVAYNNAALKYHGEFAKLNQVPQ